MRKLSFIPAVCAFVLLPACAEEYNDCTGSPLPAQAVEAVPTDEWAVRLMPGTDPRAVAEDYGAVFLGPVGSLADVWRIRRPGFRPEGRDPLACDPRVTWIERQVQRHYEKGS